MDRREFLTVCATAAVAAACGGADDDADATASTVNGEAPMARTASVVELNVGQLVCAAFTWSPPGTLACDGAVASTADWPELAALLGRTYGGDGTSTFGLPLLAERDGLRWLIAGTGAPPDLEQSALLGEVRPMVLPPPPGSRLEATWLPCDGRRLPIKGNEALYALIGATYGGDGRIDFALPALTPLGGAHGWWISGAGQFPTTTCDARTPVVPDTAPLGGYVGSIVHLPYADDVAAQTCDVVLCQGQVLHQQQFAVLSVVVGNRFGGDLRNDTFALPALGVDAGIRPAIVVDGPFPERP